MIIAADALFHAGRLARGWLRTSGERVEDAGFGDAPGRADERVAGVLAPGFVDVHCHGGGGAAFGTDDPDDVRRALGVHRAHGTTTLVASLVTAASDTLVAQLRLLEPFAASGELAGVHLEGPWLSRRYKGAHDESLLADPLPERVARLVDAVPGLVRMVTLAPELKGAVESVRLLSERGVVAAVGHTGASYRQVRDAVAAGASGITHLFNGMPDLRHRSPGPVLGGWQSDAFLELIADGIHVDLDLVRFVMERFGHRVVLITDAMAAAGAPDGDYVLGALPVTVSGGVARLTGTETIAGSTLTLDAGVRTAAEAGVPLEDALRSATELPAAYLGLRDVGTFAPGRLADAVVLDDRLEVVRVLRRGAWLS